MTAESHREELNPGAKEDTIILEDGEAVELTILLNKKLREVSNSTDFSGALGLASLNKEEAEPLNEVFKQLVGRDHDEYERPFGRTMLNPKERVKPLNVIRVGDEEKTAASKLLEEDLVTVFRGKSPYRETLRSLEQKFAVQKKSE